MGGASESPPPRALSSSLALALRPEALRSVAKIERSNGGRALDLQRVDILRPCRGSGAQVQRRPVHGLAIFRYDTVRGDGVDEVLSSELQSWSSARVVSCEDRWRTDLPSRRVLAACYAPRVPPRTPCARARGRPPPQSAVLPFGNVRLPPVTPRLYTCETWCPPEQQYGFSGFSYPPEDGDCSAPSNSFEKINEDLSRMKRQFGATMVRIYGPECRDESIWRNLVRAGAANNLSVSPSPRYPSSSCPLQRDHPAGLVGIHQGPVAGAEERARRSSPCWRTIRAGRSSSNRPRSSARSPIGDFVDVGYDGFIADLDATRGLVAPHGLPISMSEDWDTPGILASQDRTTLGPVGKKIRPLIDNLQRHPMPYYHANIYPSADHVWPYFESYIDLPTDMANTVSPVGWFHR
ncbi:hypothetical protein AURDEDRAFT_176838 [Auricularia subglabra TFB-10046 SS5]|uniref:Uncharacterized protein n=1 Tax=Auricularia subglabra (strain TFB-10046 / SS5) TaxID=717982 RepID=J0LC95_AURST|nr:hypothetical protein AURDEDRAFT_176838 [Auricularia subglabra TFB-10046 SS5]